MKRRTGAALRGGADGDALTRGLQRRSLPDRGNGNGNGDGNGKREEGRGKKAGKGKGKGKGKGRRAR